MKCHHEVMVAQQEMSEDLILNLHTKFHGNASIQYFKISAWTDQLHLKISLIHPRRRSNAHNKWLSSDLWEVQDRIPTVMSACSTKLNEISE